MPAGSSGQRHAKVEGTADYADHALSRLRSRDRSVGGSQNHKTAPAAQPRPYSLDVQYGVLGPLEVCDGDTPVAVAGRKERLLLATLLAARPAAVSADELVATLWGERPPATASRTLEAHVARLRGSLGNGQGGPPVVRRAGSGWLLAIDTRSVDSGRFEEQARRARDHLRSGQWVETAATARAALSLWRGPAFDGFRDAPLCVREALRLEGIRAGALDDAVEAELAMGAGAELVPMLEASVADDPLREQRWGQLMVALYRAGRQADALEAYARARRVLRDEIGVAPGLELVRLQAAVLHHTASLHAPMQYRAAGLVAERCPFKALAAYTEKDAALLLGRERLSARVVDRLRTDLLVCLVGASGSGKSSLLHAGVVPAIRSGALPGSDGWSIASITPTDQPMRRLQSVGRPDLLVLDQFEELFTLCGNIGQRRGFTDGILALANSGTKVVVAVRSDHWVRCAELPNLADVVTNASVLVGPLADDDLRRVMTESSRRAGLTADDDLVETVVAAASGHDGALPLVSTALARTWERRANGRLTVSGYEAAGVWTGRSSHSQRRCGCPSTSPRGARPGLSSPGSPQKVPAMMRCGGGGPWPSSSPTPRARPPWPHWSPVDWSSWGPTAPRWPTRPCSADGHG
jgi:DNA-binding SARP family transcriptional activator